MTNGLAPTDTTDSELFWTYTFDEQPEASRRPRGWILPVSVAALAAASLLALASSVADSTDGAQREPRPAAQIIQDEIDAALADRDASATSDIRRPAYLIVHDEIERARARRDNACGESADRIMWGDLDVACAELRGA